MDFLKFLVPTERLYTLGNQLVMSSELSGVTKARGNWDGLCTVWDGLGNVGLGCNKGKLLKTHVPKLPNYRLSLRIDRSIDWTGLGVLGKDAIWPVPTTRRFVIDIRHPASVCPPDMVSFGLSA